MIRSLPAFLLITVFSCEVSFSQINLNVKLYGILSPDTAAEIYYSGCWGYAAPDGKEYAILGGLHGTHFIDVTDTNHIYQAGFTPGVYSHWREIKVANHYAYIISQGFDDVNGMQIIDLSYLPDSVHLAGYYTTTFTSAHTISIDELGNDQYLYVNGALDPVIGSGVHILSISDPIHPVEESQYSTHWIHDSHIRGDTMYACDFDYQNIDIVNVHDKAHPVIVGQITYTGGATHSCWTTKDGRHLMVCNEVDAFPSKIYDVSDLGNITDVSQYRGDTTAVVHNVCIKGDFAYVANDVGGFRVVDLTKPDVPVEVGFYDTYLDTLTHSHGCFETYPFLPSGKMLASDREHGLFVFHSDDIRAGRIYGAVVDKNGKQIIHAHVELQGANVSTESDLSGNFKFGALPSSSTPYQLIVSADSFTSKIISPVVLNASDSLYFLVQLDSLNASVQNQNISTLISINQNPFHDQLVFTLQNIPGGTLSIYNLLGQKIFDSNLNETSGEEEVSIDCSDLPNGMYMLSYKTGKQNYVARVIKE